MENATEDIAILIIVFNLLLPMKGENKTYIEDNNRTGQLRFNQNQVNKKSLISIPNLTDSSYLTV